MPVLQTLLLQVAIIPLLARLIARLMRLIGQPQVIGEMVAGILLGPSLLGRIEHMKCDIYDRRGAAVGPVASFTNDRYRRRVPNRRSAYWMLVFGLLLILIGPLFLYWDWLYSGGLIYPTLIGLNCFILALRLFYMGFVTLHAARARQPPP
jgi:hypothetical protein